MRRIVTALLVASALVASAACKQETERPPPAGDLSQAPPIGAGAGGGSGTGEGGTGDGGEGDSGDAGGACTDLPLQGVVVDQNAVTGDPPNGSGGTVADGTYDLTLATLYVGAAGTPGPTGLEFRGVLRLSGGTFERVHEEALTGQPPQEERTSGTFAAGGTTFSLARSCPTPAQDQLSYSAISNTLVITSLLTRESFTFTLR
jgi:hypothetical protein